MYEFIWEKGHDYSWRWLGELAVRQERDHDHGACPEPSSTPAQPPLCSPQVSAFLPKGSRFLSMLWHRKAAAGPRLPVMVACLAALWGSCLKRWSWPCFRSNGRRCSRPPHHPIDLTAARFFREVPAWASAEKALLL